MLQLYIKIKILKYYDKLYKNPWFLIKKKCDKYHIINIIINVNQYIIYNMNLSPSVKEFTEKNVGMVVILLINFYSGYN